MSRPRLTSKLTTPLPDRRVLRGLMQSRGRITDYSKVTAASLKPAPKKPGKVRGR